MIQAEEITVNKEFKNKKATRNLIAFLLFIVYNIFVYWNFAVLVFELLNATFCKKL